MKCTGDEWDHCRVEKMGCYGCYYNDIDIEKAKEKLKLLSIGDFVTWFTSDGIVEMEVAAKTLLQYIEQLEKENKQLKISYKLMENEAMKDGLEERKKQKERINKYIEILNKYKERSKYIISNNRLEKLPDGVRAISEYFTPDTVIQMLENIKEGFR